MGRTCRRPPEAGIARSPSGRVSLPFIVRCRAPGALLESMFIAYLPRFHASVNERVRPTPPEPECPVPGVRNATPGGNVAAGSCPVAAHFAGQMAFPGVEVALIGRGCRSVLPPRHFQHIAHPRACGKPAVRPYSGRLMRSRTPRSHSGSTPAERRAPSPPLGMIASGARAPGLHPVPDT